MPRQLLASESVTEGCLDKVVDRISEAILDTILARGRMARVPFETLVSTALARVAGGITTEC